MELASFQMQLHNKSQHNLYQITEVITNE